MHKFAFHHVGVAVPDLSAAIRDYRALFGYEVTMGPIDDPIQKVTACFMSRGHGDPVMELIAPLGPHSPIDRALKKGGGVHHICYAVPDMPGAIRHLTGHGAFLLGEPVPAVAFNLRQIAWLMTEHGLLVELLEDPVVTHR
jgi:methylmalonyl-CoA/ethylmalonyl-CoA epimerase